NNGLIPPPTKQLDQLHVRQTRFDRRPGKLEAIEVQDRQHGTDSTGLEKLNTFPPPYQRTRYSFPFTKDSPHQHNPENKNNTKN
ncbi:hypothetical protein, partial [Pseudomonas syringae group genomosp. 7]